MTTADMTSSARGGSSAELWRGVTSCAPVLFGTIPYALVLGAQAAQKGLSVVEVPLMTGLNFAGGSEFAAIQLWTSPPHILLIVAITFLVNSRHPRRKVFPALFLMCDESWALGLADARRRFEAGIFPAFSLRYYLGAALAMYVTWVVFTTTGALLGPLLGDVQA